jgi:hypothetical protein
MTKKCFLLFVLHLRHSFIVVIALWQRETEEDEQEVGLLSIYLLFTATIHIASTLPPSYKVAVDPCPHKGCMRCRGQ